YPQRGGKLGLSFALSYNNLGIYSPGCLPTYFSSGQCAIVLPFQSGFSLIETSRPTGGVACSGELASFGWNYEGGKVIPITLFNISVFNTCQASLLLPDGTNHPMMPSGPVTFMAADASGYRIDLKPGTDPTLPPHYASVIMDPEGTRYPGIFSYSFLFNEIGGVYPDTFAGSGIYAEDTNGNKITQDGSEWLDTMGRHIPGFPSFQVPWPAPFVPGVMGATIDYSGCTGPLPISGAVVWNPPGIDGGTYPLKFCFASVPEINPGGVLMSLCDGCPGVQDGNPMVIPALPTIATQLQSVVLPNGQAWTFTYSGNA